MVKIQEKRENNEKNRKKVGALAILLVFEYGKALAEERDKIFKKLGMNEEVDEPQD